MDHPKDHSLFGLGLPGYIYIAGRDGFPAPASQLFRFRHLGIRSVEGNRRIAGHGAGVDQGEENATKTFRPPKKGPSLHESLIFMVNPW